jgi:hypothetical protein
MGGLQCLAILAEMYDLCTNACGDVPDAIVLPSAVCERVASFDAPAASAAGQLAEQRPR